jgi:hypothetical protein
MQRLHDLLGESAVARSTSPASSIRWASVPQPRASFTRRTELEELREPIISSRSQLLTICLTAACRLVAQQMDRVTGHPQVPSRFAR